MDKRVLDNVGPDASARIARVAAAWSPRDHATLWVCAIIAVAIHVALWQVSEPPTLFSDFYKAYYPAAEVLWLNGGSAVWPLTETGAGGFVNLPILAWFFVPFVPLGDTAAGWLFLAIGVLATAGTILLLGRMIGLRAITVVLPLFVFNGPLINSLKEGNTTHFVLLLLVLALYLMRSGSDFGAGLVLGLSAVVKLPLLLYGLYFLMRGRWYVVAGGVTAIGIMAGVSLAVFGLDSNIDWFGCCVEPFIGGAIPAFNVQSLDGFSARLVTGTARLMEWAPMDLGLAYRAARSLVLLAILGATFYLLGRFRQSRRPLAPSFQARVCALEFATVLIVALVVSPLSWSHYYLLMLLPWSLYIGGKLPLPNDAVTRRLVWASIILSSLPVIALPLEADWIGELAARTLVSVWLFGAISLLAALLRGAWLASRQASLENSARLSPV